MAWLDRPKHGWEGIYETDEKIVPGQQPVETETLEERLKRDGEESDRILASIESEDPNFVPSQDGNDSSKTQESSYVFDSNYVYDPYDPKSRKEFLRRFRARVARCFEDEPQQQSKSRGSR